MTRGEWAEVLEVQLETLTSWLEPGTHSLPAAETLRVVWRTVMRYDIDADIKQVFVDKMASLQTETLLRLSNGNTPSCVVTAASRFDGYFTAPLLRGLDRALMGLTITQREKVLIEAAEHAHKLAQRA